MSVCPITFRHGGSGVGQVPKELEPTRSVLHFFGAEVRRLREGLGMSQARLGRALFAHKDLIRKIEAAERMPSNELINRCDQVLLAKGALRRLKPMIERERTLRPTRESGTAWSGYRSTLIDRLVLDWLLSSTDEVQVPSTDGQAGSGAADRLRQLRRGDQIHGAGQTYSEVVGILGRDLDSLIAGAPPVATGLLELAGYEAVDLGADGVGQRHYLRALEVVTGCGDRLYGGYLIGVSLGHLALHCGDAEQAARLASAALRGIEPLATPAVRAALRAVLARAYARRGDEPACVAALLQVEADLARSDPAEEPVWIRYFSEADLADEKAHCFFDLGRYGLAQREAVQALRLLGTDRVRRLAIDTALHSSSLARSRQLDHACTVAHQAIEHAANVASFRSAHRVVLMLAELQPYADMADVRAVMERARVRLPVAFTPAETGRLR
jgi:transcriptional regulator with XRE-family HTH domain